MEITTDFQALKLALKLAIQTEDDERYARAMAMVYEFAGCVAPEDISLAKSQVMEELGMV
jgi:hypothetical protein